MHTSLKDCYFSSSLCSPAHSPPTRPSNSSLISSSSSHGSLLPLSPPPPYDLGGVSFSRLGFQDKRQNIASSSLLQLDPRGKYDPKLQFPFLFLELPSKTLRSTCVPFNILPATSLPPPASLLFFFPCSLPPSSGGCGFPPPSPLSSLSPLRRNLISQSVSPPLLLFSPLFLCFEGNFFSSSSFLPPGSEGRGA